MAESFSDDVKAEEGLLAALTSDPWDTATQEERKQEFKEDPNVPLDKVVAGVFENHDSVNHPQHYSRLPSGIEVIEITEHLNNNQGNAIKYILRAPYKGNLLEDLKKAAWYIDREIGRVETYGE